MARGVVGRRQLVSVGDRSLKDSQESRSPPPSTHAGLKRDRRTPGVLRTEHRADAETDHAAHFMGGNGEPTTTHWKANDKDDWLVVVLSAVVGGNDVPDASSS